MKKNIWLGEKGLTLLELLLAFAIFAIFIPSFISFARTAVSNNTSIQNQANATNQLKNVFNYISADAQMASTVTPSPSSPANCVLELGWINYPSDTIVADYTLLNGVLTRIYTDSGDSTKNGTMVIASNVNSTGTTFNWSPPTAITNGSLAVNLVVTLGNANEVRQFQITPRVTQRSAQLTDTLNLVTPSPSPANYGSTVTLTANFTPSTVSSGTVTFLDSSSPIPIGTAPVISGSATCTVSNLSVATHILSAVFSGDANYKTSTSNTQSLTINKGATSTTVTAAPTYGPVGTPFTFNVASLPADATGNVVFTSNVPGDSMNITIPVSAGAASTAPFTLSIAGVHTITATYSGDIDYNGSSGAVGVTVNNPVPVLTTISPGFCYVGDSGITLTASGSSFVSSSVIYFGATALTTTFVNSGSLTATVPTTVAGNFSVTVQTPSGGTSVNAPTFVVIGAFNAAKSTLTPTSTTIIANGITTQVLTVQVKDLNGVNYTKVHLTQ